VYPDCISGVPNITFEEWIKGETKLPLRKPINLIENSWNSQTEIEQPSLSPSKHKHSGSVNINNSNINNENVFFP
jgi:hypothetical protein